MPTDRIVLGSIQPRLFTPPLGLLTRRTTLGYDALDFWRTELNWTPLPHQRWLILHLEELNPDGSPRWRKALISQARQSGKTAFAKAYALWNLKRGRSSLFSSASLDTSRRAWEDISDDAEEIWGKVRVKKRATNGEQYVRAHGAEFAVVSANRNAARGRTVPVVMVDELRVHDNYSALSAIESTAITFADAKILYFSNAGDARAVPLANYRALGIAGTDPTFFFAEYSAPEDCDLDDIDGWRQANPTLNRPHGTTIAALRSTMTSTPAAVFRTENLNQSVSRLNAAVTSGAWDACYDEGTLDAHKSRVCLGFDVSADLQHATLVAAVVLPDGRCRVETVAAWTSLQEARQELPELVSRIKPRGIAWYPGGGANAMNTSLKELRQQTELTGQIATGSCMDLADVIAAGRLAHNGDELLGGQIVRAAKQKVGDAWRFNRDGDWTDAVFAMAGSVHLARKLPASAPLRMMTARTD